MRKGVIIQSADEYHWPLLEFTSPIHRAYANRHGLDYWLMTGRVDRNPCSFWDKHLLLSMAMAAENHEVAIWLDADAMVVQPDADISKAPVPFGGLGMSVSTAVAPAGYSTPYLLAGVIYAMMGSMDLLQRVRQLGNEHWNDEEVINKVFPPGNRQAITILSDDWHNHVQIHGSRESAIIQGWHCMGDPERRLRLMKAEAYRRGLV